MNNDYELVLDTADLKIRAYGMTFEDLFRNALKGTFAGMKPQGKHISYKNEEPVIGHYTVEHHVVIHSLDREALLIDFLSECLDLADVHNEAYFNVEFSLLSDTEIDARSLA